MRQEKRNPYYILLFTFILFTMTLMNTFQRTKYAGDMNFSEITINLTFFVMFIELCRTWLLQKKYEVSLKGFYTSLALFMLVFIVSFFTSDDMGGFDFLQLMFLFIFILGSVRLKWTIGHAKVAGYIVSVTTLLFFVHWVQAGFVMNGYAGVFRNGNFLGIFLFSMLYFTILVVKYTRRLERLFFFIVTTLNFILIVASNARSVLLGIAVAVVAWVFLKQWKDKFRHLIYVVLAGNFLFVGLYIGLQDTYLGNLLNKGSFLLFNKNLFSGRSEIWGQVIHAIIQKPVWGYGVGTRAADITSTDLTAHNMYLQILLEVGLVGFLLFVIFILAIWHMLVKRLDLYAARWSACFMLGILVYESFELTLFQNNFSIAILQWLVMTFGVSFVSRRPKDFTEYKRYNP